MVANRILSRGDGDTVLPEGLVTVGSFCSPMEAQMAKGMLESAGVECFLVGENVVQGLFETRTMVLVRAGDEAAARGLLDGAVDARESDQTG